MLRPQNSGVSFNDPYLNLGLTNSLGRVHTIHVPHRNSKLICLLQDSLGTAYTKHMYRTEIVNCN